MLLVTLMFFASRVFVSSTQVCCLLDPLNPNRQLQTCFVICISLCFVEKSTDVTQRTLDNINFVPSDRSSFVFPAPYNTKAYRLTIPSDGTLFHQGYSYWNKINKHDGEDKLYVLVSFAESGVSLISVDKNTDEVTNLGPIWPRDNRMAFASGEDIYMSTIDAHSFFYIDGSKMMKHDFIQNTTKTVFDLSNSPWPNTIIWQAHSSADETRHVFTLRNQDTYAVLGCAVAFTGNNSWALYTIEEFPDLDECNMDKSGRYITLLCPTTVFIDLDTGAHVSMKDEDGGIGHIDTGYGTLVSADNYAVAAWRMYRYDFDTLIYHTPEPVSVKNLTIVYTSKSWQEDAGGSNHLTWANAKRPEDVPWNQQFLCGSSQFDGAPAKSKEIICFRPDGSLDTLIVAPVMISMGPAPYVYEHWPFASIEQSGSYIVWSSNMLKDQGNEVTMFLVKVPWQHLVDPKMYDVDTTYTLPTPTNAPNNTPTNNTPTTSRTNSAVSIDVSYLLTLLLVVCYFGI